MLGDLCARLAYMTPDNLAALEEMAAGHPGGKERDRFPIANQILEWAAQVQPPGDDASPLIRAVFAHAVGRQALAIGYAPELLEWVRRNRRWPGGFALTSIQRDADGAVRQLQGLDARLSRGDALAPSEVRWRDGRRAVIERCQRIADTAAQSEGAA
jgi:hypothetical protein